MRKLSKLFVAFLTVVMSMTAVEAASTMNKATNIEEYTDSSKSSNKFEFEDKEDGTYLNVTVNITEDFKNEVLNHVPGKDNSTPANASLGIVYYGLKTGFCSSCTSVKTSLVKHTEEKIADAKELLPEYQDDSDKGNYYLNLVQVQYMGADGKWANVTTKADGTTSIGANLVKILKEIDDTVTDTTKLVYGKNYRFFVNTSESILIGFKVDSDEAKYVNISYNVEFPVYAVNTKGDSVYYEDLQAALDSEDAEKVYVTGEYDASDTITVPEGVLLVVKEGGSIAIPEGKDFIVKGQFSQEYNTTITVGGKEVYEIAYYVPDENGTLTVSKKAATPGETITFDYAPNKGYRLKKLSIKGEIDGKWTDLELLEDGKSFIMPASDVEMYATFEKDTVTPPDTGDINIMLIVSVILTAVVGTVFAKKKIATRVN